MSPIRLGFVAGALLVLHSAVALADDAAPQCGPLAKSKVGKGLAYDVDQVWSGTRVAFGGIAEGNKVRVGYYDRDRWLTVAELDLEKNLECRVRLGSRFEGWDSHNEIALAQAPDGSLHVAGNMHVSPLVYARGVGAEPLKQLKLQPLIGKDEDFVTYPTFLTGADGALAFAYRTGRSGDGDWLMDRYAGGKWTRVGQLFAGADAKGSVSAYPTDFVRGDDGWYHVAIVWRRTYDVATNFAITYARTRDFQNWEGADGRKLKTPIGPDDADVVERTGENAGLLNNAHLVLAHGATPIVLYTRYADDKSNGAFAARPDKRKWRVQLLGKSKRFTRLKGGGSLADVPKVGGESGDVASVVFRFPGEGQQRFALDADTLALKGPAGPKAKRFSLPPPSSADTDGMADADQAVSMVTDASDPTHVVGALAWVAQAPNRDKPRECKPPAKRACDPPPSTLRYVPAS